MLVEKRGEWPFWRLPRAPRRESGAPQAPSRRTIPTPETNVPRKKTSERTSCTRTYLPGRQRIKAVGSVPGKYGPADIRNVNTGSEPGQKPRPVRQRAKSKPGRIIKCATADRPVPAPCVEDDVTVQHARRNARHLVVENLRAGRDLPEVGECDSAMVSGVACVPRAVLLYMEMSVSCVVRRYRSYFY